MSTKHLTAGSEEPPRVNGLVRLYSMDGCPFAQRARMVLKVKDIPHEIVNINLTRKPDWYLKIHPEGKVPALLVDDKIIIESLDVSDYIEDMYPENPLYPNNSAAREKDKQLIKTLLNPPIMYFYKFFGSKEEKSPEQWISEFLVHLQPLEYELSTRGTFFGGNKPAMIDYMLWPWAERSGCISIKLGQKLPFKDDEIPNLRKWAKAMNQEPVVKETYTGPERYYELIRSRITNVEPVYDP